MPKDARIEIRIRNAPLYHAIFQQYPSVAAFCRAYKLVHRQGYIGELLNLKRNPQRRDGQWRPMCLQLSKIFKMLPEDLFPGWLYQLKSTKGAVDIGPRIFPVPDEQLDALPAPDTADGDFEASERSRVVQDVLTKTLLPREAEIARLVFMEDEEPTTIADNWDVTPSRMYQILRKALRKLRHPKRARLLQPLLEP